MYKIERKVQYYETDMMGIVHHSNYIKWMEEIRTAHLESIGLPYQDFEAKGIMSPVVNISVDYKAPCTYGDEIVIEMTVPKYTGVQTVCNYVMKNKKTGEVVVEATSRHCFVKDGKVISLKREVPKMHEGLEEAYEKLGK